MARGGFPEPAIDDTLGTATARGHRVETPLPDPASGPGPQLTSDAGAADNLRMRGGLVERPWIWTAWEPS